MEGNEKDGTEGEVLQRDVHFRAAFITPLSNPLSGDLNDPSLGVSRGVLSQNLNLLAKSTQTGKHSNERGNE